MQHHDTGRSTNGYPGVADGVAAQLDGFPSVVWSGALHLRVCRKIGTKGGVVVTGAFSYGGCQVLRKLYIPNHVSSGKDVHLHLHSITYSAAHN